MEPINPEGLFKASFYSQGVKAAKTIYVSGQVGSAKGQVAGGGSDFGAEARQALENVRQVVESGGGTMADVVSLTCYLVEMELGQRLYPIIAEMFPGAKPSVTAVVVKSLGSPKYKVEIQAVAVVE
jgi:enamine deaminase RidA (YjgF/YER057c/UK114 family)